MFYKIDFCVKNYPGVFEHFVDISKNILDIYGYSLILQIFLDIIDIL